MCQFYFINKLKRFICNLSCKVAAKKSDDKAEAWINTWSKRYEFKNKSFDTVNVVFRMSFGRIPLGALQSQAVKTTVKSIIFVRFIYFIFLVALNPKYNSINTNWYWKININTSMMINVYIADGLLSTAHAWQSTNHHPVCGSVIKQH